MRIKLSTSVTCPLALWVYKFSLPWAEESWRLINSSSLLAVISPAPSPTLLLRKHDLGYSSIKWSTAVSVSGVLFSAFNDLFIDVPFQSARWKADLLDAGWLWISTWDKGAYWPSNLFTLLEWTVQIPVVLGDWFGSLLPKTPHPPVVHAGAHLPSFCPLTRPGTVFRHFTTWTSVPTESSVQIMHMLMK